MRIEVQSAVCQFLGHRFLQKPFRNWFIDGTNVQMNWDDLLKNESFLFDILTGFIAERVHFFGNLQWC